MTITSGAVLFAVLWFLVLFVVLPLRLTTQGEAGQVAPGTPSSAPHEPNLRRKVKFTTAVAALLWLVIAAVIVFEVITIADIDLFSRFGPDSAR